HPGPSSVPRRRPARARRPTTAGRRTTSGWSDRTRTAGPTWTTTCCKSRKSCDCRDSCDTVKEKVTTSMKIYQPMLYVGLGGTGCLIGAELERRLREELCGPDGTDLQGVRAGKNLLPYQLPSCLQFVYADLNEAELNRLRRRAVPTEEHVAAAARTS